jgi:uncharacterized membrane protein
MKAKDSVVGTLVNGALVVLPLYLAVLLLLRTMQAVDGLVKPIAALLPDWLPVVDILSLLVVLLICLLVGVLIRTAVGRVVRTRVEKTLFSRLPGYSVFQSLTQRIAGDSDEQAWQPALVEIEDSLVPAFIVEEFDDGRYTVFVPSIPTPFAGTVYVLTPERVHKVDVPFAQAVRTISQWGSGSKDLVAKMEARGRTGVRAGATR